MNLLELTNKIKHRLWYKLVVFCRNKSIYPCLYRSFWHYKLSRTIISKNTTCFYSARPNPGAGIGHQLANWIAGYWFCKQFDLMFAHIPFSTPEWEAFLGFGEDETSVVELIKSGYKTRKLPLFDENNIAEFNLNKLIIQSYIGKKIIFIAEQDQFYADQYGLLDEIKSKFHQAKARQNNQLIYSKNLFNIAIHVRRGDIVVGHENKNPNLTMRWQDNEYFTKVLESVVENLQTKKSIAIYLFSQGEKTDFQDFEMFENLYYCLDMKAQDSFLHMVYADLLITSKSSFSYNPALLSNGIKICPIDFWHGYPETKGWILTTKNGEFEINQLSLIQ